VKFTVFGQRVAKTALYATLLLLTCLPVQAKVLRLRNQLIPTKPTGLAAASLKAALAEPAVSGLCLIQFHAAPTAEQRAYLESAGVSLLHYVPDDGFIARLDNVRLSTLRALPFIYWVGEYKSSYKVHPRLRQAPTPLVLGQTLNVTVLLAPRASGLEISRVRSSITRLQQTSVLRSGTVLRGKVTSAQLNTLALSSTVLWIEPAPNMKLVDEVASKLVAGDGGEHTLLTQSLGYDGAGVAVAVADSGLNNGDAETMHPDLLGRTPAFFAYGGLDSAADEHSHGTHVSGIIAGNGATGEADENGALYGLGVAPGAKIIAQRIFDGTGNFYPPGNGFSQMTQDAKSAGADIGSNSWGDDTQGRYDASAMEFDELVRDYTGSGTNDLPYILEFSAGNAGPGEQTVGSPAVAKNVIATGACENDRPDLFIYSDGPEVMADFSSRGPCEDGRIKPDIVAPGTWISSLQSQSASDQYAWLPIDSLYQYQGGTSQAGPHVSGAAAIFVQYYRSTHLNATPSPALVKAALINSAIELDQASGNAPIPNMDEGWGRADLTPFFDSTVAFNFIEQTNRLTNGQVFEYRVLIAGTEWPFKATLAYTDVPGFPGAIPALVNDLDLEVVAPDGTVYYGNQFSAGESIPNPPARDSLNNVEGVHLASPVPGEYLIRVRAQNVVQDILGAPGQPRQDFALVVSGQQPQPGVGVLHLDRASYRAPDLIKIVLLDTDQAGKPTATVRVSSTTETNAETLTLRANGSAGGFTNVIATATGSPALDGKLQISHNAAIQISYSDVSASVTRIATARADLVAPVLSAPATSNSFGEVLISWSSDEPATSIVRYGTNANFSGQTWAETNTVLNTNHSVEIGDLVTGKTYYYYVVSADEAGNVATNRPVGSYYSFTAPVTAPLLLVDEYQDTLLGAPPLTGYTDPLDAIGVKYDVWDVGTLGVPKLSNLRSYKAVIWRISELLGSWSTSEFSSVSNYVYGGGALFISSMEALSRLSDTNFIRNVLQVQSSVNDENGSTLAAEVIGTPNETVGKDIDIVTDYGVYETLWGGFLGPDLSDTITPTTNAMAVLRNDAGDVVGLRWPGVGKTAPGRVVFFSFPLDAVPMGDGSNDRVNLLRNVLSFLIPGASGLTSVSLDSSAYTLPSMVEAEVDDSARAGAGSITIKAATESAPAGISVTLYEQTNSGIFQGAFPVVSLSNSASATRLRATNGNSLTISYTGGSGTFTASATIDTVPPILTSIAASPDYVQATITWDASEETDALVEFGSSALLGRSSYSDSPSVSHTITLANLESDHTYYYRVTSRDLAGNTTSDDNHGKLYSFHTLKPIAPPWSDSMDTGATNWSTYNGSDNETQWTLGIPNNGVETTAHSAPDAWGSNLNGDTVSYAQTYLLAPAMQLPEKSSIKLHFWHSYEFTSSSDMDIQEYGQVLLVTNDNSTTPITLASYSDDASGGWVEEEFDLSAYAGLMVYVVWDYELLSFDSRVRPGWLVDDVSLTVSNYPTGTILVSNNLWQAGTILTGPQNFTNSGRVTIITNALTGQYTLKFAPVPYYYTPAAQTNTLTNNSVLVFQGNYTFPDANANGISDLWEQYFFGSIAQTRTARTDTDGNGFSDYAAFIAGTNPNKPQGPFQLSVSHPSAVTCRLQWPAYPAGKYQVLTSTNLQTWTPYTNTWLLTNLFDVRLSGAASKAFFRVVAASTLPSSLSLSAQPQANKILRLTWPSSIGRGYCLEASSNMVAWTPFTPWAQAVTTNTSYTLSIATNGPLRFFRVQVQP
jgi:hypothetical protein